MQSQPEALDMNKEVRDLCEVKYNKYLCSRVQRYKYSMHCICKRVCIYVMCISMCYLAAS